MEEAQPTTQYEREMVAKERCPRCRDGSLDTGWECTDCGYDAIDDVAAERQRQKDVEGWTEAHDDTHSCGELVQAAYSYIWACMPFGVRWPLDAPPPTYWPWDAKWWKPRDKRRNLVRAAALLVAEIERLDRNQYPLVSEIEKTA